MRGSRNIFTGTVRIRTKGKAREAWVDMTAHSTAKHTSWMQVNMCIRSVRTWRRGGGVVSRSNVKFQGGFHRLPYLAYVGVVRVILWRH